jgi:hypothetical protein
MTIPTPDHDLERNSSNEKEGVKQVDDVNSRDSNEFQPELKWTFTRVIAVAALCIAYVGKFAELPFSCNLDRVLIIIRLSIRAVHDKWFSDVHF